MKSKIHYLNTDLEIVSNNDLTSLVAAFEGRGVYSLHFFHEKNAWYARLETNQSYDEPEATISKMLAVVESFSKTTRVVWDNCTRREFDIGYEGGQVPRSFNQVLSQQLLERITMAKASLSITIYSPFSSKESE